MKSGMLFREKIEPTGELFCWLNETHHKNWEKMNEAARKETCENLRDLRKQRNQVAEWYGSMKISSADAWGHIKNGFSDAYKALEDAREKSENKFRPKE